MKTLIKNATIVNAADIQEGDILLHNSKIEKIGKKITDRADKEIDAKSKYALPGLIDLHVHLRTPGREDEEDLLSGAHAAAHGGFTTVFCMPNTSPSIDNEGIVQWIREEGQRLGVADIIPIGALTKARAGAALTEFGRLQKAGCRALSDDGSSLADSGLLRRALEYAKMFDLLVISHCEDEQLSRDGAMMEGFISSQYGIGAIPSISEAIRVFRDIALAQYVGARLHLAHISTALSLEVIRAAKQKYSQLTCETAPHYFALTVDDVEKNKFSGNFKVNPPLAEAQDVKAVQCALREGVIDCIATDHAPHSPAEKELPFESAPFGFSGLETAFSLTYTHLVKNKILDLQGLVQKLSAKPAELMRLTDRGHLREGYAADVVIVDINRSWEVTPETLLTKSKNTPFLGKTLRGVVEQTIHKGKVVYQRT